jgi:hypothetical protein
MDRKAQMLIAGASAVAVMCLVAWVFGGKHVNIDEKSLPHSMEPVEAASEDSFPASDPPAWTGTTGPRA